jgi:aspartyl-tRNA(Asn)/glutamyl-tRNA(Gln) amidotransferase subunit A
MATPNELTQETVAGLAARLRAREVSAVEVTQAFLARADALEPDAHIFITRTPELALEAARAADARIGAGKARGPLDGVPFGIKDIMWLAGVRCTSGSEIEAGFVPNRHAGAVARFLDAGAVPVGKTNTVEFAFDPTGRNAHYGMARNPWGPGHLPGGSSSGTGAGVASGAMPIGFGTDTGGSIRIPSALCGLTGLKPTFGLVSRAGVTPLSHSLDTIGPLARSAEDAAIAMDVLAGHDPADPASRPGPAQDLDYRGALAGGVRGLRIGVPREYVWEVMDPQVAAAFHTAMEVFRELGAEVVEVSIPQLAWTGPLAVAITTAEAAMVHGPNVRAQGERFDQAVRRRVESGMFISAERYAHAQRARVAYTRAVTAAFAGVDLLATPTVPVPSPEQGSDTMTVDGAEVPVREALLRLTRIFNLSRLPALALPAGFAENGLPLSVQLAGPAYADALVLRASHAFQQATDWHARRAPE